VLHGHQHVPFAGTAGRVRAAGNAWIGPNHSLLMLGSGSTGCVQSQLSNEFRDNSFSIYTPTAGGLRVQTYRFNAGVGPSLWREVLLRLA
jgi:hypothetical protein